MNTGTLLHFFITYSGAVCNTVLAYVDLYCLMKPCEPNVGELPYDMP